jgi:hypothetical protein
MPVLRINRYFSGRTATNGEAPHFGGRNARKAKKVGRTMELVVCSGVQFVCFLPWICSY